jgi:hypothetical protein
MNGSYPVCAYLIAATADSGESNGQKKIELLGLIIELY